MKGKKFKRIFKVKGRLGKKKKMKRRLIENHDKIVVG